MSAGAFLRNAIYQSDAGLNFPVRIQPETITFELDAITNAIPTGSAGVGLPSARVSGTRKEIGVNCRKVRFRFTGAVPDGYLGTSGVLSLPVLDRTVWAQYSKNQTGNYTIGGTAYPVEYVGKTGEAVV